MKRFSFILTALMVAALLLAACGGGAPQNQTPGAATSGPVGTAVGTSPAGVGTETTTTGGTGTETATTAATVSTTEETTGTATAPAGGVATGTATTSAGTGNVPATGNQFVLLSKLMAMPVNDQSGQQVGSVNGVVVNSASAGTGASSGMETGTPAATSAAGSAGTTETPAATAEATAAATDTGSGAGTGVAMGNNPVVSFVVVNVTGGSSSSSSSGSSATAVATDSSGSMTTTETPAADSGMSTGMTASNQVLVPWQAFSFASTGSVPATGGTVSAMTGTETPAAGATDTTGAGTATVAPTTSSGTGSTSAGALTLTVDQSILAGAPAFDSSAFAGTVGPDVAQYWSGQGLSIPSTGSSTSTGGTFLLQSPLTGLEVMDKGSQSLGQVSDFVVNTTTGELVYAVLSGGTTMGSNFYVVPMTAFNWQSGSQGAATGASTMGQIQANFSSSAFSSAPSITSIDQLDLSSADWQSQYDTYWSTAK